MKERLQPEEHTPPRTASYWFPAKRYGWGWGMPSNWKGITVLVGFLLLLVLASIACPPGRAPGGYLSLVFLATGMLLVVCWLKGEPPRWRWG